MPGTGSEPMAPNEVEIMSTRGWFDAASTASVENPSTKKITASGFASSTAPVTAVP